MQTNTENQITIKTPEGQKSKIIYQAKDEKLFEKPHATCISISLSLCLVLFILDALFYGQGCSYWLGFQRGKIFLVFFVFPSGFTSRIKTQTDLTNI